MQIVLLVALLKFSEGGVMAPHSTHLSFVCVYNWTVNAFYLGSNRNNFSTTEVGRLGCISSINDTLLIGVLGFWQYVEYSFDWSVHICTLIHVRTHTRIYMILRFDRRLDLCMFTPSPPQKNQNKQEKESSIHCIGKYFNLKTL